MIPQPLIACLLFFPLLVLIINTLTSGYWSDYKKDQSMGKVEKKANYNIFLPFLVVGVIFMWISWVGGIILLFLNEYYNLLEVLVVITGIEQFDSLIELVGLGIFYIGAFMYNYTLYGAKKYLRPAPAGILNDHKLIQNGSFGIIRHPLYTSYLLLLGGLSLLLHTYFLFIPTIFLVIGIYPTAKAEETMLLEQFGEAYEEYMSRVGMFLPKIKKL